MTTEEKQKVDDKDSIEENGEEDAEEEYEGRQWNKMIIGVAFVLIVVVLWYIITSVT